MNVNESSVQDAEPVAKPKKVKATPKADYLFEVSWEVCNKVGGIYTVVKSKVGPAEDVYGDKYFLIGPYFQKKVFGTFEELPLPDEFKDAVEQLSNQGIKVHFGSWVVKRSPKVFLLDFSDFTKNKYDIKKKLWDWYQIDSLSTEFFDFDEPIIWSFAVGVVLEALSNSLSDKKLVAQFHEWLAGAANLYLKHNNIPVSTVFTTHATTLGRSLSIHNRDLYDELDSINPDEEARKLGPSVFAKHLLEKASAQACDVFTTVSEITGIEAEKFLGRKPDVLLFNGLDMSKFPTFEEATVRNHFFNQRIKQFLLYYFFPFYKFDLDNTLVYFIAGRYEFRDKGIDVFIDALADLNEKMKADNSDKNVVAFFWVPANVKSIKQNLLQNRTLFFDIKDSVDDNIELIKYRLMNALTTGKDLDAFTIFGQNLYEELRPKMLRLKASEDSLPPISTHDLVNDDEILNNLRRVNLLNKPTDPVKVVYYPIYLTGADGLLDTSYYESMVGSDLGVFPSYYEPWGYTPLEAAALGVSSLTTDLSGFGRYLCEDCQKKSKVPGIFVLPRFKKSYEEIVTSLSEMMHRFANFSPKERTENKISAFKLARTADWSFFFKRYVEAHNLAVDRLSHSD